MHHTCLSVSPGDNFRLHKRVDMPEFIFSPFFQNKDGKNAIETGLMCSLAVVASLLLCITRRIVFKETKLVV